MTKSKNYKVLITTSGVGSRLGDLTKNVNKSLIKIGKKTVIEHIVDSYSASVELVITLGYHGEDVKKFLQKKYPHRQITYVKDDTWHKESGGSLGCSMLQAKKFLQCPFVFQCNDTIVKGKIPSPVRHNWNGGSKGLDSEIYSAAHLSSFTVKGGYVEVMNRKGAEKYDLFHIGMVGVKDYKLFWQALERLYEKDPFDKALNDCAAMQIMVTQGVKFKAVYFKRWFDTGNLKSLQHTIKNLRE